MSKLGTLSVCSHLAEFTADAEQGQSLSSHLSVQYFTWCLSACRTLQHCHMLLISPSSAKDLLRCLISSLWAGCPTTESRVSPVECLWQGRDSSTQSLQEQSLSENEGLQMLRKQIDKFALQGWLPLFCLLVQLNKPFNGFSWKS